MNIFKSFFIFGCTIFAGIALSGLAWAETVNAQANEEDIFNIFTVQDTGQSFEVQKLDFGQNSLTRILPGSCDHGETNVTIALGNPRLTSIEGLLFGEPAPIEDVKPTTTVNLVVEKINIPFNGIPGGFSLKDAEELAELFGGGITVTEDPDNENRIILTAPALTVEESHDVLCEVFNLFTPPRILIKKELNSGTLVAVDFEFVRFENTPLLLTRKWPHR